MAINNYATTLRQWENIIRVNLKVTNPALLKSGALGILSNYLASIKFDTLQYYAKAFQEMNLGLAQDFNSMLYHASIYGASIEFATASVLTATLIIPEISLAHINSLTYVIPKNIEFIDTNGIVFTTTSQIKIEQGPLNISATVWDEINGIRKLSITKTPNPNIPGKYLYLVHTSGFKQSQRSFYSDIVDVEPIVGNSFQFDIGIEDLQGIESVRSWANTGENLQIEDLVTKDTDRLAENNSNIEEYNIKFYKFESSNRDEDLFLEMFTNNLNFQTGDGIHGALPSSGTQIITEIKSTQGSSGNVPNSEFLLTNVHVTERWSNNTLKEYTTRVNGMSSTGSIGGQSIESIGSIRSDIFNKISTRHSIVTENDYENIFEYNNVRPFVDAKFIDAQAFVFLFNVIRENDTIIPSTSWNAPEFWLTEQDSNGYGGPFYPKYMYGGYKLISPFYYKNQSNNTVDAYILNPEVSINLKGDLRTPDLNTLKNYKIDIALTYDFTTNTSYIEILAGAIEGTDYYFICDQFRATITEASVDHGSPYTYQISKLFVDEFCVINEPITGVKVHAKNSQGEVLASYTSDGIYEQLNKKQTFYKYFQDSEEEAVISNTGDIMAYLNNIQGNSMSTSTDLVCSTSGVSTPEAPAKVYVLRLPFLSEEYFLSKTVGEMYDIFNQYFIMNITEDLINYNTLATQTFHNTIDIPPKYYDSLFERNTMPALDTPKIPIVVEIHADRNQFMTSKYDTETDFDIALRIEIIKFLKKKEGFVIEFFETDLEKHLYDTFNPLIKNVTSISPSLFQVNSSQEIYRQIQDTLDFTDMLDFIPPYFYFDYANLNLTITW